MQKSLEIASFPLLSKNTELQKLIGELGEKARAIHQSVTLLQDSCTHTMRKVYEYPNKIFDSDKGAVIAKECTECGFIIEKPKGSAENICESCWGQMEYKGREPGQGGGTHYYECTQCHRTHTST